MIVKFRNESGWSLYDDYSLVDYKYKRFSNNEELCSYINQLAKDAGLSIVLGHELRQAGLGKFVFPKDKSGCSFVVIFGTRDACSKYATDVAFVLTEETYLLNDEGKTIERIN